MRIVLLLIMLIYSVSPAMAQLKKADDKQAQERIAQIKKQGDVYLWGEAQGKTLNVADRDALADLIGQISTSIQSDFTLIRNEDPNGYSETYKGVIKTYSQATLSNTERVVVGKEPKVTVFRYIKRTEIAKIFVSRKNKIIGFVESAIRAEKKLQMADALRYYYWAQTLLRSHPDGATIKMTNEESGEQYLLASWIPEQINNIFNNIRVMKGDSKVDGNFRQVELFFTYKKEPVSNFDFTYWDGQDWSNITSAKDGRGVAELPTIADENKMDLKGEYIFVGEATIDTELKDVMETLEPVPYKSSNLQLSSVSAKPKQAQKEIQKAQEKTAARTEPFFDYVKDDAEYKNIMAEIERSIVNRSYDDVRQYFDSEGWDMFTKLVNYGRARICGTPNYRFAKTDDGVICRSMPLAFYFPNNNCSFVEDVVFEFAPDAKIVHSLSFGLAQTALEGITGKTQWSEASRLTLIRFLENYKTAYALKRIDYISSIFADDALIIVGNVLKKQPVQDAITIEPDKQVVRYTKQTKEQYIKNLSVCFQSNEFINLRFADNEIRKAGSGEIYGIQIKQDYFSSNYGDTGYLFLMVDLNDRERPVIHVRAWQPEKDPDFGLIDLSSFTF
ncbi:MAG: LPP20 family lipoprotein [Salinivirgaceae bacterium]|nr:LPP20 family lipoprotein [Salinivirgaceae bacterium]